MLAERILGKIESAAVLDRPAAAITDKINEKLRAGRVKDLLSGTHTGHAAHPVLITVPIGAWIGASWLDLTGGSDSRAAARRLVGLGTLAAVPAALTGASDWADTVGPERRLGFVHAVANYTAVGLYAGSWVSRHRGRHGLGVGLAVLGAGVMSASGWLGGHLAHALGVGVDTTAFLGAPTEWTDVAAEADLPDGKPIGVSVGVVPVLLLRRGTDVVALYNRCTHRGAPLHKGPIVDGCIECPWHGSRFRLVDGGVVRGPATQSQPMLAVRVEDGRVQVRQAGEQHSMRTNPVGARRVAGPRVRS